MLFIILSFALLFTGCRIESISDSAFTSKTETAVLPDEEIIDKVPDSADTGSAETAIEADQEMIVSGFYKLLDAEAMPDELLEFVDKNVAYTVPDTMTLLLENLEYKQKSYIETATQYLFEGDAQQKLLDAFKNEAEFTPDNIEKIKDENLKADILKMFEGGFKFINLEGSYYPIIDFKYLKKYSSYLSIQYRDYLDVRAAESENVHSRDAGLTISWDELSQRMIKAEKYLDKYKAENPRKIEISRLFLLYFASYLYGQDNTPTRDWSTNAVYEEVLESYRDTVNENPSSKAAGILSNYLSELENSGYILTDDILNDIGKYLNEVINIYDLDSPYIILEQLKHLYYQSEHAVYGSVRLAGGSYSEYNEEGSQAVLTVTLSEFIAAGDLDGNGINDAAAVLIEEPAGEGTLYYLHAIYNGGPYIYSIANTFLGDSVKIKEISIKDGKIFIDMLMHKEDDPACCPTVEVKKTFKLDGYDLKEI
ncbi:MAG: hypothetical protein JW997_02600 [Actinobacteria bacterium]|nr:hypothetical protein [Actinomycetota bacterium]